MKKFYIFLIVISVFCVAGFLIGCQKKSEDDSMLVISQGSVSSLAAEGAELFCTTDSEEKAAEIAEAYGIELVSYSQGVATFHTEEDPQTVIQRGIDNDLPLLEINQVMHMN